ncbi:MAG: anti-sigma factor domain-containing protein [Acidimicrobiia bacterium]
MMTEPSHDELRELLGAYALDAVDDFERGAVERHLATCTGCRGEVDQHLAVAAMMAQADSPVPDGLWDRVRAGISQSEPAHVVQLDSRRKVLPFLSAAAVTVLVALVSVQTVRLEAARDDLQVSAARLAAIEAAFTEGNYQELADLAAAAQGAVTLALSGDAGSGIVTILPDGTGYLTAESLSPLDDSETYQLWAVQDGKVISAGVFGSDPHVASFHIDPELLEGLVLTAEAAGGVAVSEQPAAAAWFPET